MLKKLRNKIAVLCFSIFTLFSTQLTTCGQNTYIVLSRIMYNPTTHFAGTELTSFVANLFYSGADDPFPTVGAGGELGKSLHKLPKAFKIRLAELLEKTFTCKVKKTIVAKIQGNAKDCLNQFNRLIETIPKNRIKEIKNIKDADGIRKTLILKGESKITFRTGKYSSTKTPTIQIDGNIADNVKKGRKLEIKFE